MVIFTARQNLANLNEVKINLIVKFANLAGKSYHTIVVGYEYIQCIVCSTALQFEYGETYKHIG